MKICPNCGNVNDDDVSYCSTCGTLLSHVKEKKCTNCGASLEGQEPNESIAEEEKVEETTSPEAVESKETSPSVDSTANSGLDTPIVTSDSKKQKRVMFQGRRVEDNALVLGILGTIISIMSLLSSGGQPLFQSSLVLVELLLLSENQIKKQKISSV